MKPLRMFLLGTAAVVLAGCVNPYLSAALEEGTSSSFGLNAQQARVAAAESQYYAFPELFTYDEKTKKRSLKPYGLKTADVSEGLESQARDWDSFLSYTNGGRADSVDALRGFREGAEKAERVTASLLGRLKFVSTYNAFIKQVGKLPDKYQADAEEIEYYFPGGPEAYSMRLFYPHSRFRLTDISFTARYLEAAREERTLQRVERLVYTASRNYAEKVTDLRDKNKFDWKGHRRGWVIEAYKVVESGAKPQDNAVQYIEVFRMRPDMSKTEEKPAMYGFLPSGGSRVNVFLIDFDLEGTQGYGVPDEVWSQVAAETAEAFIDSSVLRRKLVELYDPSNRLKNKDRPERQRPPEPPIYTAIVRSGDIKIDLWDVKEDGWDVPIDYKDYSFVLELLEMPFDLSKEDEATKKFRKIKGVDKKFKQGGTTGTVVVIEHWRPKEEYAERNVVSSRAYSDITIRRDGKLEETADITWFAEGPVAIDYCLGDQCWSVVDEDDDGNLDGVFTKRREISKPEAMKPSSSGRNDFGGE